MNSFLGNSETRIYLCTEKPPSDRYTTFGWGFLYRVWAAPVSPGFVGRAAYAPNCTRLNAVTVRSFETPFRN